MPSQAKLTVNRRKAAAKKTFKRFTTISANELWCMRCFRHAMSADETELKKTDARKPVEFTPISCEFGAASTTRCALCNERATSCDPVPALLTGNARDIIALESYARSLINFVWDDAPAETTPEAGDEFIHYLDRASRKKLVAVVNDLRVAFSGIVQAHCAEFNLSGPRGTKASHVAAYRDYILRRRKLLLLENGPRPFNAEEDEIQAWNNNTLLRLDPTDAMYKVWLVALEAFAEGVSAALELAGDLDERWVVRRMEAIPVRTPAWS